MLIDGAPLPRADALPDDIRDLMLHQKQTVSHEQFGRDIEALVGAIAALASRNSSFVGKVPKPRWSGWVRGGIVLSVAWMIFGFFYGASYDKALNGDINFRNYRNCYEAIEEQY